MFTGIVTEVGTVAAVRRDGAMVRVEIVAPRTIADLEIGDSVSVDGICLTAVRIEEDRFTVEAVAETLARSTLGDRGRGDRVDLERPVSVGERFDGHLVQGHVDGVGIVIGVGDDGEPGARSLRILLPERLSRYVVEKGSIAVDGVSLTIAGVSPLDVARPWFEVVLIPHTLEVTVLGERIVDDRVNIEVDVLAKYLERWMEVRG